MVIMYLSTLLMATLVQCANYPPAIPLAVRSPYLSTWSVGSLPLNEQNPFFWDGPSLDWTGLIRIDGKTYSWLGHSPTSSSISKARQSNVSITATRSIFSFEAGPIDLKVTFLSPVEPKDLIRQSLPFSYLNVDFNTTDAKEHEVQVYAAVGFDWLSGDRDKKASSTLCNTTSNVLGLCASLLHQELFHEVNEQIEHGTLIWAANNTRILPLSLTSFSSGHASNDTISCFVENGTLPNSVSSHSKTINFKPVHALARYFGNVTKGSEVFAVGLSRDPAIQYVIEDGEMQNRSLLFLSEFGSYENALEFFLADFHRAYSAALAFDLQVHQDSLPFGTNYSTLMAYSIRQTYGATEVTVSRFPDGSYNTSDILIWLVELSSNDNMNTVDVIYPAFPLFYYASPEFIPLLLEPLLRFQASGQWKEKFALHDIGAHYPNATGHPDGDHSEAMPLEESGNMMHLALAYAQLTGDNSMFERYPQLFRTWAELLEQTSLIPSNQLSTDDFMGSLNNQTNLALKGILGMGAYSELCHLAGDLEGEAYYKGVVRQYMAEFYDLALSRDKSHLKLAYQLDDSWSLLYNLFADKLLNLRIVPDQFYDLQEKLLRNISAVVQCKDKQAPIAIALDTRKQWVLTPWLTFQAGAMYDQAPDISEALVNSVLAYAHSGLNSAPLGDRFNVCDGRSRNFHARPVIGGHAALLALQNARKINGRKQVSQSSKLNDIGAGYTGKKQVVFMP